MLTSLPLVSELRHPAMRPRHWKQLMKAQTPFRSETLLLKFAYCASGDTPSDGIEKCKSQSRMHRGLGSMLSAFVLILGCCRRQGCAFRWERSSAWGTS